MSTQLAELRLLTPAERQVNNMKDSIEVLNPLPGDRRTISPKAAERMIRHGLAVLSGGAVKLLNREPQERGWRTESNQTFIRVGNRYGHHKAHCKTFDPKLGSLARAVRA
ncbi:MAG: hypothetical protein NTZ56_09620 [Acidobacteria bacterium]|nr:hypothetical protein [Acidobacteriota bacterium]